MLSLRRLADATVSGAALILGSPILLGIAAWLRLAGVRPILHTESRVGRFGRPFRIHKFRTLRADSPTRPTVAVAGDPRITGPGRFLRRWRLDELPQLVDVLAGSMSLVGPRPQTAANLEASDAASLAELQRVRPGLTGPAAIEFLSEDEVLAEASDPEGVYRRVLLPEKVRLELEYVEHRTPLRDLGILLRTATRIFSTRARRRSTALIRGLLERSLSSSGPGRPPEARGASSEER